LAQLKRSETQISIQKNIPARLPNGEQVVAREEHKLVAATELPWAKSKWCARLWVLIFINQKRPTKSNTDHRTNRICRRHVDSCDRAAQFLKIDQDAIDNDGMRRRSERIHIEQKIALGTTRFAVAAAVRAFFVAGTRFAGYGVAASWNTITSTAESAIRKQNSKSPIQATPLTMPTCARRACCFPMAPLAQIAIVTSSIDKD